MPKYGLSSHGCSCIGSLILGNIVAWMIIGITALISNINSIQSFLSNSPLFFIGLPVITAVLWGTSYLMVWTPAQAFKLIKWIYQDFWLAGKEFKE